MERLAAAGGLAATVSHARRSSLELRGDLRRPCSICRKRVQPQSRVHQQQRLLAVAALVEDEASVPRVRLHHFVSAALRLTSLAVDLACTLFQSSLRPFVAELQRKLLESREAAQQRGAAARRVLVQTAARVQDEAADKRAYLAQLALGASDSAFIAHLRCLDNPKLDLEHKWGGIGRLAVGKEAFSSHLDGLFQKAQESSTALGAACTPASLKAFWKSEHTAAVIREEEALKRMVYLQMLSAAPC